MNKTIREFLEYLKPLINANDYKKISGNKLFEILREKKILKAIDGFKNVPNDKVQELGLFTGRKRFYEKDNKWNYQPLITEKGVEWLIEKLEKDNYIVLLDKPREWQVCDAYWIFENIGDERYIIQYKNIKGVWNVLEYENTLLSVLIDIKNKNQDCRYCLK